MKLDDVQSPEWRARAVSRINKKLLGFVQGRAKKTPVLVAGLQRSGTTMLTNIFHLHPDSEVFDEASDSKTFLDFRIRSLEVVRQSVAASHYRFPCFKILADSHVLPLIMRGIPDSRVVWMYREYGANAASRLKKFPHATAAIRSVCEGRPGGGWFAEGVSESARCTLQCLDRSAFTDFDYACLVWWARNQLYLDLNLAGEPYVRLLRYETLVVAPTATMHALFDWIGMSWSAPSMRFVHRHSLHEQKLPAIDAQVDLLCRDLLRRLDEAHDRQWSQGIAPALAHAEMQFAY